MKKLQRLVLVQFFLFDAVELSIGGHAAFLGQNGSGKTSILDGIQIAMLGAHGNYLAFNTQSVGTHGGGRRNPRTIRDYCLGVVDDTGEAGGKLDRRRDSAITYITLVFEDDATFEPVSIGVCLRASVDDPSHEVLGMYVLPGLGLTLADHIEKADGGDVPLHWTDFAVAVRGRFKDLERTPFFTAQPMNYIGEMLHALQPKAKAINPRDYLKVFNKSVLLRNIDSVDLFVRDYVIEPQVIDRKKAKTQIDYFKQLNAMLQQVKQQIEDLRGIRAKYEEVKKYATRVASLKSLEAAYAIEEAQNDCAARKKSIEALCRSRRLNRHAYKNVFESEAEAKAAYDHAAEALSTVPGVQTFADKSLLLQEHEKSLAIASRRIEANLSKVAKVLHDVVEFKALPSRQKSIREVDRELSHQANRFEQGHVKDIDKPIVAALGLFEQCKADLDAAEAEAIAAKNTAEDALSKLTGMVRNAEKGGVRISDDIAKIIARLHAQGIEAVPVCNLVEVRQREWQSAIETYLKGNREALVVTPGREREAVAMIRKLPEQDNPFIARVIQPYHLRDERWDESNTSLAGNLLVGENAVALSYLRALFGSMKCVDTEDELEKNPRALTIDGMLSANFTTRRMRLFRQDELLFGKRMTHAEKVKIHSELAQATTEYSDADRTCRQIGDIKKAVTGLGDLGDLAKRISDDAAQAVDSQAKQFKVKREIDTLNLGDFKPLRDAKQEKEEIWRDLQSQSKDRFRELTTTEARLRSEITGLVTARKGRDTVIMLRSPARSHKDIDDNVIADYRSAIDSDYRGRSYADKMASCETRIKRAEQEVDPIKTEAIQCFDRYVSHNSITLGGELSHWRTSLEWVAVEEKRLVDTELVQRDGDVKKARVAAEEAFRNDVAVRMKESIDKMRSTISDINKTLATCPAFTNGERYKFEVKPAEAHKAIYSYIMQAGDKNEPDMFALGDDSHVAIMDLLDQAEPDDNAGNPLDDYRLLFSFDLVVSRDGRKDTVLSKRLGVGSNGEHRAPFYVIAGAAMAAAYRIDAGKHSTGAGVMLLDEAFYGMDQQNSLAAGRFLDSVGLQMIMAAPEADHSKLAPMVDTIYELNRFEMDVYVDPVKIKEPARRLLTSDMPSEHPGLISLMVESIQAGKA
jgi:chromosome segregation protein